MEMIRRIPNQELIFALTEDEQELLEEIRRIDKEIE